MISKRVALLLALVATGCSSTTPMPDAGSRPRSADARKWKVSHLELEEQKTSEALPPLTAPLDPGRDPRTPDPRDPNRPDQVGQATATSGSGRLSRESIEATLGDAENTLGQCAEGYSTFAARIMVAPNGSVSDARVTQSAPDDPRMRDCLTEALRRMRFQSSTGMVPLSFSLAIEPY